MSIYCWGFEIKTLPAPPDGINQATPEPSPEVVSTVPTKVVNRNDPGFDSWLSSLLFAVLHSDKRDILTAVTAAVASGNLNLDMDAWKQAVALTGDNPPYNTVQLQAIAQWKQIYSNYEMNGDSSYQQAVTEGVTTTDEQSESFGEKVGVSVKAGWGPVSATLTAEFSAQQNQSHSVSFTTSTTQTAGFDLPAQTFIQIWQLHMQTKADDGSFVDQATMNFQTLTYPAKRKELSQEEAKAKAEALLAKLRR